MTFFRQNKSLIQPMLNNTPIAVSSFKNEVVMSKPKQHVRISSEQMKRFNRVCESIEENIDSVIKTEL